MSTIRRPFDRRNKRWWVMILGALVNSVFYATILAYFSVSPVDYWHWLLLFPVAFFMLIWLLSQVSFWRFFELPSY